MKRITHTLEQGSSDWHSFRAQHFGASEASAVIGMSPYNTRDDLLKIKKTGVTKDVSASTQRVFDKGHEVEGMARPIVEEILGVELYPVTMSFGKLSASCDGLSMDETIAWECKQFNKSHFEQVKNNELPEIHWPQCQQVLHVTGAEKLFFTVTDGTKENTVGMWVYPDADKIKVITASWDQFAKDLETYTLPVQVEKVEAEVIQSLPVPSVVVRGEITTSNLNEITPKFDAYLVSIKTELSTDADFADAEANAKNCRETAKRIAALQDNIIAQMVSVNEVNSTLENYKEAFNKIGLKLEKAVKDQKEMLKTNAIMKARDEYSDFVNDLNKDCVVVLRAQLVTPDFITAIKGVKTIESMHSRINECLANAKVQATTLANEVKAKIEFINASIVGYAHLVNIASLSTQSLDYIKLHIQSVKNDEDKRIEKRKDEYEARIKAQAEADASLKVEIEKAIEYKEEEAEPLTTAAPQYFYGTEPSVTEIVSALAKAFTVDEMIAHRWLLNANFLEYKKAA